jgi:hypothetical protein
LKSTKGSIVWKALVQAFPLVGKWIVWHIRNGEKVILGKDPWLGVGNNYKLSHPLLQFLIGKKCLFLSDLNIGFPQLRGRGGWKNAYSLNLPLDMHDEWNSFINLLCEIFITLDREYEDSLCWSKNSQNDSYMIKLGYKAWLEEKSETQLKWWWKPLWKIKAPPRCKLTLWLALNNKLLTLDNWLRRGWCGPNICPLCKEDQESTTHIFISCPFAEKVTHLIKDKLNSSVDWNQGSLEECFRNWIQDKTVSLYAGLPSIMITNVWWERKNVVFKR